MPCVPLPNPTLPTLPKGLSLSPPPLPQPPTVPNPPCCTLPPVPLSVPKAALTLPVDPIALGAIAASLSEVRQLVLAYLRSIPLPCDRD